MRQIYIALRVALAILLAVTVSHSAVAETDCRLPELKTGI